MSVPDFLIDDTTVVRTLIVGLLAYLSLVAILRISGKRTLSQMNAFDFIVTVALGSTLATILLSSDVSLLEGVVALVLLVVLQFALTWTSQRFKIVAALIKSEPTALVYRGNLLRDAMRRERVLEVEINAAVREAGYSGTGQVDLVVLETDGTISVIGSLSADRSALSTVRAIPESE
jgi:uncharacterized membrane protein YcaP (DUF421 family)